MTGHAVSELLLLPNCLLPHCQVSPGDLEHMSVTQKDRKKKQLRKRPTCIHTRGCQLQHVIPCYALIDLWVILKSPWSFVHVVHRDHMNSAQNADQGARTCGRFVYSIVKITRFYYYQTWLTFVWEIYLQGAQRFVGFFLLIVLFGCWLVGQANSDHMWSWYALACEYSHQTSKLILHA